MAFWSAARLEEISRQYGLRVPPDHACRVYRTDDAGDTWTPLSAGLPQQDYYGSVLRDAMCADDADPAGIYVGTRNGEVYASIDDGASWSNDYIVLKGRKSQT